MRLLLAAADEADRLEQAGRSTEDQLEQLEDPRVRDHLRRRGGLPVRVHESLRAIVLMQGAGVHEAIDVGVDSLQPLGVDQTLDDQVALLRPRLEAALNRLREASEAGIAPQLLEPVITV